MTTNSPLQIQAEPTPNPNTCKFVVNWVLLEKGTADYPNREAAQGAPLAQRLFALPQVTGAFVGSNFITITKSPETSWEHLIDPVVETIRTALRGGVKVEANTFGTATATAGGADGEVERQIREILDREIRPAVAMDGGDITFHSYKDGVVTLHLRGACSACPSATFTLKMGVENRLKALIPQVREVVQV